mgnify:CR=1 FL=1|jgi:acyl-CoA thioesterase
MNWNGRASIISTGNGSFSARIDHHWLALKGLHGGIVAALVVEATDAVLADHGVDGDFVLRAATFGYLSTNDIGESIIEIDIVRRGRSMIATHARVVQNGAITTVARLHHSRPRSGLEFSDAPPPMSKPNNAVRLDRPTPNHFRNVEAHLHPDTTMFGDAERAEWIAWARPLDTDSFDSSWLTMYGDFYPPAVFAKLDAPTPAVTIEYSIQIHDHARQWTLASDEHLATRMHTFHSHDGLAVEDGSVHQPDGTLLATFRQTRLSG